MRDFFSLLKEIFLFALLFIWQLPQNIVALVMLPFMGKLSVHCYRHFCVCFEGSRMKGGISLGNFAFVSKRLATDECDVSHEVDGHTVQSKILGPLYLFVIGIPSLCWATYHTNNFRIHPNYYTFYTEKWANKCAGIEAYKVNWYYYKLRKKDA